MACFCDDDDGSSGSVTTKNFSTSRIKVAVMWGYDFESLFPHHCYDPRVRWEDRTDTVYGSCRASWMPQ
jgi:hypothetical protein